MIFKNYINLGFSKILKLATKNNIALKNSEEAEYKKLVSHKSPFNGDFNQTHINRICGSPEHFIDIMLWPCNTFAICASFLDMKGDYRQLITGEIANGWTLKDKEQVNFIGNKWYEFISTPLSELDSLNTDELINCISKVFKYSNLIKDIDVLRNDSEFKKDLLILCLAADRCFHEVDVLSAFDDTISGRAAEFLSIKYKNQFFQLSMTDESFGAIHYKSSICQSGISLNSISQKLAYIGPEINLTYAEKLVPESKRVRDTYNILILPWPKEIQRDCFKPVNGQNMLEMTEDFDFFEYAPIDEINPQDVINCFENSIEEIGDIDIIVLPECAVSSLTSKLIKEGLNKYCVATETPFPTIITGVYEKGNKDNYGKNKLELSFLSDTYGPEPAEVETVSQNKHHRWFLDRPQIYNYKLGNMLSPRSKWWEYTSVTDRTLVSYYCQEHKVQISPLICEDLARQDPVAPVVRALGPDLIVALLLDGGQIKGRWSGRYASFLSEDPGSSVLTVSPLGMTLRSDGTGFAPSRCVAFWSEEGFYKELELEKGKEGIILTLEKSKLKQWSADGRNTEKMNLKYAGHVCI
jgi:hypothetical protein